MPQSWSDYLPLCEPSDVRKRLTSPETPLQLSAGLDTQIGLTVASSVFTTGIPHGLNDWDAVQFQSTLTLPTPLAANTTYYIRDATQSTFKVALVIGGAAVTITAAGTGQVSVQNWSLNASIESKIVLADEYIYDQMLALVMDHIRPWSLNTFYGYFPIIGYGNLPTRTPRDRAVIVLDNISNPTDLKWAAVDVTIWLMVQDGVLRNQVGGNETMYDRGPSLEGKMHKRADESIATQARLLIVDTASGAYGLFNFDETTDSVSISLL